MRPPCPQCGGPKPLRTAARCRSCENAARREHIPYCACGKRVSHHRVQCWDCFTRDAKARAADNLNGRLDARIDQTTDGCWVWRGRLDRTGYGITKLGHKSERVHRVAYRLHVGPVPEGLELDHICRNRACCNPAHLEPVTHRENTIRGFGAAGLNIRKTTCKHGHPFTPENTFSTPTRYRTVARGCRTCQRGAVRRYKERQVLR